MSSERAGGRAGRDDSQPFASERLHAARGTFQNDRLLPAQIMTQLEAGCLVGKDHILCRYMATNKLHGLIHVLMALIGQRKRIAVLLRSKSLAKNNDCQRHGSRHKGSIL